MKKVLDHALVFLGLQTARAINNNSARFEQPGRVLQQRQLSLAQSFQLLRAFLRALSRVLFLIFQVLSVVAPDVTQVCRARNLCGKHELAALIAARHDGASVEVFLNMRGDFPVRADGATGGLVSGIEVDAGVRPEAIAALFAAGVEDVALAVKPLDGGADAILG